MVRWLPLPLALQSYQRLAPSSTRVMSSGFAAKAAAPGALMAAARTASSMTPATGADMNAADATAKVTVTSSAATWVSATSFGTQEVMANNIAAASVVCWRLLVGIADEAFETPGYNAARAVGYGIAVAIMLWLLWLHERRLLVPTGASSQGVPAVRDSSSPQAPCNIGTRWLRMLLVLVLVPVAAGEGNDPCARPCGQKHSCGELNESFACDVLSSGMGCDCSGCCLASLSPLAPPTLPPPLPPPPSPPMPLLPPMAPGGLTVGSTAELRTALASGGAALVYLLPIVYPLGGLPLNVSGISVTLESLGGEATIDAEASIEDGTPQRFDAQAIKTYYAQAKPGPTGSRAIDVSGGGRLVLRRIRIINGAADWGGGLLVQGAGSSLRMEQVSVQNCVATGPRTSYFSYEYGGGRLACSFARPVNACATAPPSPLLKNLDPAKEPCFGA